MTTEMRKHKKVEKKKTKKKQKPIKKKTKKNKSKDGGKKNNSNNENIEAGYDEPEIPELQDLEKEVLKYIIGQDEQVRQMITGIYKAMAFTTIKSNMLVIGHSGTGKTATIK